MCEFDVTFDGEFEERSGLDAYSVDSDEEGKDMLQCWAFDTLVCELSSQECGLEQTTAPRASRGAARRTGQGEVVSPKEIAKLDL